MSIKQDLEMNTEGIMNELQEIQGSLNSCSFNDCIKKNKQEEFGSKIGKLKTMLDNIDSYNDSIYCTMENMDSEEYDKQNEENETLREILSDKLSWEDKIYYRINYGIEIE